MPWSCKARKAVISCEKPGSILSEVNHLSNSGKEIKKGREPPEIPEVAASETGGAQTASSGVVGPHGDDP